MNHSFYNNPDTWSGGYYEISLEYNSSDHDNHINKALKGLCKEGVFKGLWADKFDFQTAFVQLPLLFKNDSVTQLYGVVSLSRNEQLHLPCSITIIRVDGDNDSIVISIPQGAFEQLFSYQYPLTVEFNPWLKDINELFVQIAISIYEHSPFDLALIGEEISGYTNIEQATIETLQRVISIVPLLLQKKLGIEGEGHKLSSALKIFI